MDKRRLIPILVAFLVVLGGGIMFVKSRPKGPDCGPLGLVVRQADRPVVALANLVGDDPKLIGFTDKLAKGLTEAAIIHRQPLPQPDFTAKEVPDAVAAAEEASQFYLNCGATAVIWGVAEKEAEVVAEDPKSKKPVTKGVYTANLWVTVGAKNSIRVPRTVTGEEANEVIFRIVQERAQAKADQAAQPVQPPAQSSTPAAPPPSAPAAEPPKAQ